jgi:hypothetical protein
MPVIVFMSTSFHMMNCCRTGRGTNDAALDSYEQSSEMNSLPFCARRGSTSSDWVAYPICYRVYLLVVAMVELGGGDRVSLGIELFRHAASG